MCPPVRTHWRHLANTIELVLPSAHLSPQPKRQIDRFSRFCIAHSRKSLYTLQWTPLSSKNAYFHGGSGPHDPHLTHDSLGPSEPTMQTASRSVQAFSQGSLVWQTDRPADHAARSVTIGRICVRRSTAMQRNNNSLMSTLHSAESQAAQ